MSSAPQLTDEASLEALIAESHVVPVLIFKHSTRCSISSMALNRMASSNPALQYHIVDVIANRPVSNKIAEVFSVHHESPQLLIIHKGECLYEASHLEIQPREIFQELQVLQS
ncbi:MAG: bacillithiol system redox-active protein YtxJ [Sphingomonadales bacterium]|nr:bacillithiol system redox-active protein YtxJ [Sphingomonadales bacterium]